MNFTTVDLSRTHIANREGIYLGNVNSYNNALTQFVTRLFRLSTWVLIGGRNHALNNKSYKKLLGSLNISAPKKIPRELKDFDQLNLTLPNVKSFMVDHLSQTKVNRLTNKLMSALTHHQPDQALQWVGRGADVNQQFNDYGSWGIHRIENPLPSFPIKTFSVTVKRITPLLLANQHQLVALQTFMQALKGDPTIKGAVYTLQRTLLNSEVKQHVSLDYVPRTDHYYRRSRRHDLRYAGSRTTIQPVLHTSLEMIKTYQDTQTVTHEILIDRQTNQHQIRQLTTPHIHIGPVIAHREFS